MQVLRQLRAAEGQAAVHHRHPEGERRPAGGPKGDGLTPLAMSPTHAFGVVTRHHSDRAQKENGALCKVPSVCLRLSQALGSAGCELYTVVSHLYASLLCVPISFLPLRVRKSQTFTHAVCAWGAHFRICIFLLPIYSIYSIPGLVLQYTPNAAGICILFPDFYPEPLLLLLPAGNVGLESDV